MSRRVIVILLFIFPWVFNGLNLQGWISHVISFSLGQFFAYLNVILIILGIILLPRPKFPFFSKTAKLWIFFFFFYYFLSVLASVFQSNPLVILPTLVNIIYFTGFFFFLRFEKNRKIFEQIVLYTFLLSNILLIVFVQLNFDYDFYSQGIDVQYKLDRAQGLHGDANNAALVCILGFVFVKKMLQPNTLFLKLLKNTLLLVSFYALFLTYSTTGLFAFTISLVLLNIGYFTKLRLLLVPFVLIAFYLLLLNLRDFTQNFSLTAGQIHKIENIVNLMTLNLEDLDSSGRDKLVEKLLPHIYENPYFGNGLDFGNSQSGHNTFLSVWADSGIIGLLIFVFLLGTYLQRAIKCNTSVRYFLIACFIPMCIFMLSLQSIINQPYLMGIFVYLGYKIDENLGYLKPNKVYANN